MLDETLPPPRWISMVFSWKGVHRLFTEKKIKNTK